MNFIKTFFWKNKIAIGACVLTTAFGIGYWVLSSPGTTSIGEDITVGNNLYVTGNVGIGTTAPASLNTRAPVLEIASGASTLPGLVLTSGHATYPDDWEIMLGAVAVPDNGADFIIKQASTDRFVIQHDSGNVGIGTTNPGAKLEVEGDILIDMMRYTGVYRQATLDTTIAAMYCASLNPPGYTQVVKQTAATAEETCTTTCANDATYTTCLGGFFWNPRGNDARTYSATCAYSSYQKYCCCE